MKKIKLLSAIILCTQLLNAQRASINVFEAIDKKALKLPDSLATNTTSIANYISSNFDNNADKVRAIFYLDGNKYSI